VNIVGEHIDYLGGTVLPFACDLEIRCDVTYGGSEIVLSSSQEREEVRLPVDVSGEPRPVGWARHVWGVARAVDGVRGLHGHVTSTIPSGAGLSSSTALEVVVALALTGGRRPPPSVLQRAEQEATGVPCGLMDQATLLRAKAGHALLLDCSSGASDDVPIPPSVGFVVIDSGTRRELSDGRYAQRRAEVEAGDVRRRRHARTEQERVLEAVEALGRADVERLGRILLASHASLRDDFEVSSPALDAAVETAVRCGAAGARLVGAGFAGCVIAVAVDAETVTRRVKEDGLAAWTVRTVDAAGDAD
jgi:galactokinase